jgi:hypothetical protein
LNIVIRKDGCSVFGVIILILFICTLFSNELYSQYDRLRSRAEQTDFKETSRYSDIINFISEIQKKTDKVSVEYFVKTSEGKEVPLLILSKYGKISSSEITNLNKLVILICAGTHPGEVEGKEASFILIKDILFGKLNYLLEKCVILYIPVFNADGNDKINRLNRISQNGPIMGVGESDVPSGININRDYSKLEIPETRELVAQVLSKWDPAVFIDCHTTNGSYHGYALTYAPPLNPNTNKYIVDFLKKELFPAVTETMNDRDKFKTQYYGNYIDNNDPAKGWQTFDYNPRYSTNYIGLINRIGILSEAYSCLDYRKRIQVTYSFLKTILCYCFEKDEKIKNLLKKADEENLNRQNVFSNIKLAVKSETYAEKKLMDFYLGEVDKVKDEESGKYTYKMKEEFIKKIKVKDYTSFRSVLSLNCPYGYILPAKYEAVKNNLLDHGVKIYEIQDPIELKCEVFGIDSLIKMKNPFQKHFPVKLKGKFEQSNKCIEKGDIFIPIGQIKSNLLFSLLEPESEDGYAFWNFFDDYFKNSSGSTASLCYPVLRIINKFNCSMKLIK